MPGRLTSSIGEPVAASSGANVVNSLRLSANRMAGGKTRPHNIGQVNAGLVGASAAE